MKTLIYIGLLILGAIIVQSCNIEDKKTTLEIIDNDRHYYPIRRGEERKIVFPIRNTGDHPFVLTDIFTSCGCLDVSDKGSLKSIPPGKKGFIKLALKSTSNIGEAQYYVTLYGNLDSVSNKEARFNINIVPDASYTKDYEELYENFQVMDDNVKDFVNGKQSEGYFVDN